MKYTERTKSKYMRVDGKTAPRERYDDVMAILMKNNKNTWKKMAPKTRKHKVEKDEITPIEDK